MATRSENGFVLSGPKLVRYKNSKYRNIIRCIIIAKWVLATTIRPLSNANQQYMYMSSFKGRTMVTIEGNAGQARYPAHPTKHEGPSATPAGTTIRFVFVIKKIVCHVLQYIWCF